MVSNDRFWQKAEAYASNLQLPLKVQCCPMTLRPEPVIAMK